MHNFIGTLLALALGATSQGFAGESPRASHVVIISIDGGKPAAIQASNMPVLQKLAASGASSWKARTVFPSTTLPSNVSMLSGVEPDIHKVLWNEWNPVEGPLKLPTVFSVAKAAGKSTAVFASKEKFKHFDVRGSLDRFYFENVDAIQVAEQAAAYIASSKPALIFIHMPDADQVGHAHGWDSVEQKAALAKVDLAIGKVARAVEESGLAPSTTMLISADHGGTGRGHGSASNADTEIPWIAQGAGVRAGFAITAPISTTDTAATALWLLGVPVPASWKGKPVVSAFR